MDKDLVLRLFNSLRSFTESKNLGPGQRGSLG